MVRRKSHRNLEEEESWRLDGALQEGELFDGMKKLPKKPHRTSVNEWNR